MLLGRIFALLAALASSGTPIFSQALRADGWTAWQVSGARAAIGFVLLAAFLRGRLALARNDKVGVAITVVNSCVGMSAYPYAAMHASLGTTVSILYLSIAWTVIYQRFAGVRERFDVLTAAMVIVGVASVVGPGNPGDTWQGMAAALLASFTSSIYVVVSSRVTKVVPPQVLACWGLLGGTVAFGWQLFYAPWSAPGATGAALGIGLVSGVGYMLLAMNAFHRIGVEMRVWSPFDLVFVWAFQTIVLGKVPTPLSALGIVLIFSAATLLAYGKWQADRSAKAAALRPSA
jgi:drug/metabolite transporter (DMT)-like permease